MNYYPFHMGDYATATRHLSWDEDAAYRRLLDAYYTREAPLPADMRQVFRLVVASTPEQREAVDTVLNEFFELTDEGWVNRRADREIEAMREKQQKQRDKANAMWEKRRAGTRQSHSQEHGIASAMPMHTEEHAAASKTDADAMPPTPTPTPTPTPKEKTSGGEPPETPTTRKRPAPDDLPPWVDSEAWAGFEAMRKAIRKPLTDAARRLAISELAKLRDAGQDPTEVLRQSTFRSWAGLFAVKSDDIPRPGGPRVVGAMSEHGMQTMRNAQALERRLFGDVEVSDAP